jgi:hypothetical protein
MKTLNLSYLVRQIQSKANIDKISLKYDNDDVFLTLGVKLCQICPVKPDEVKRSSAANVNEMYKTVVYSHTYKLPICLVDWLLTVKTFAGKPITSPHIVKLMQRASGTQINIDISNIGKVLIIYDKFEEIDYYISCKDFQISELSRRYEIKEG